MTSGLSTYRFKLQNKRNKKWQMQARRKLIDQLKKLGVKVNKPYEMAIEELRTLVNCHRKTVEARENHISQEQIEVAKSNGLSKEDVTNRVTNLKWDAENAVEVKKATAKRRERRRQERALMIQELNQLEYERELAKLEAK